MGSKGRRTYLAVGAAVAWGKPPDLVLAVVLAKASPPLKERDSARLKGLGRATTEAAMGWAKVRFVGMVEAEPPSWVSENGLLPG